MRGRGFEIGEEVGREGQMCIRDRVSGSAINLDTEDTSFGDGMHAVWRLHIFTMFVVR